MSRKFEVDEARLKRELQDAKSNTRYLKLYGGGGTFLDLGANIGQVSIDASRQFDRVVAVEAHPHTYERAASRIAEAGRENVELMLRAVAARSGDRMEVSTPTFSTGATARRTARLKSPPEGYYHSVLSIGINELIATHKPRVVKMDIEGAEYEVIDAMELDSCIEFMSVEFHSCQSAPGWARVNAAITKISAAGFRMVEPGEIKLRGDGLPRERFFVCVFARGG